MSHLLPQKPLVDRPDPDSRVVTLDDEDADEVFSTLGSDISRAVLAELYRDPATQSELAERVDTSIQNVGYHVENLLEANLITVVEQWYSKKGVEMDVFAPAGAPLVLVAGGHERTVTVETNTTSPTVGRLANGDD
ncbi:ArsR/SmtB family transcription factor [Halomicroarcula sp. GCM10025817]|uniref:ArsR/SmtB family transcription factor n=1 Tax=Haloarcula TaxID=2237 RepID=UPI0023E8640E|nr:helix-turn-helix domain-containing protein [Halomicroarcula sp. SYNS111]